MPSWHICDLPCRLIAIDALHGCAIIMHPTWVCSISCICSTAILRRSLELLDLSVGCDNECPIHESDTSKVDVWCLFYEQASEDLFSFPIKCECGCASTMILAHFQLQLLGRLQCHVSWAWQEDQCMMCNWRPHAMPNLHNLFSAEEGIVSGRYSNYTWCLILLSVIASVCACL